ncbi:hypothetical protein [Thermomonas sp.]|uniref:hypothetical protein n=1 Tax=Thermomonas sp. TaxID=1971895 RepID=UPI00391C56BA
MDDFFIPDSPPRCSRCGPDEYGVLLRFGYEADRFDDATAVARGFSERLGCDVFVVRAEDAEIWRLMLQVDCVYNLAQERGLGSCIDHINHPSHKVGQPFHRLASDINFHAAMELAAERSSITDVMISYGPGWCVTTRINHEEEEQVKRLAGYFENEPDIASKLRDIETFSEYVHAACDHL